jgi:hypothetical protein
MGVKRIVILCATVGAAARVGHSDPMSRYDRTSLAVNAHGGLGTPLGYAGAAVEITPVRWLSVEGGIGRGMAGAQLAVQPRVRLGGREGLIASVGAGLSMGRFDRRDPWWSIEYESTVFRRAIWSNVETSLESRTAGGFQLRLYAGLGVMLQGERESCTEDYGLVPCSGTERGWLSPYLGISAGYAFEL